MFDVDASGSGGSAGIGLLPSVGKDGEDGNEGNEFVGLDGDGVEPGEDGISNGEKPDDGLPSRAALVGGELVSNSFGTGNCGVEGCPIADTLFIDPKLGGGVLPKESKPMAESPVESGPLGPDTSGKLSSPMRPSRSGFIGVSVPLSATYPPYKTKSNNTTTTAVFKVCTAVLPDRKFYKILFTNVRFILADGPGTPDARIYHSGTSTSIVPPTSWIPKVFSIGLQVIA